MKTKKSVLSREVYFVVFYVRKIIFQPAKFEIFKTEKISSTEDFRLKNCFICTKPKLAGQQLFSVVGLATFFQFKPDTAFRLKSISVLSEVKHCQIVTSRIVLL